MAGGTASPRTSRPTGVAVSAVPTGQVPSSALGDSFLSWSQPLVTTALLAFSLATLPSLGRSPTGPYAVALLTLCALHAYSRSLPDRWLPPAARLALSVPGGICAGLLFGVGSASAAVGFAYLFSGHVGYRLRPRLAILMAGSATMVCVLALQLGPHLADDPWPWWSGLTVVTPVLTGLARQNRRQTLAYAAELVETTRRAAASEAEAGALAERNRIARELHDVLAHALSGVSMQLDTADALLEAGRVDDGRVGLQRARELVIEGLVQARGAVSTLREDALDLEAALAGSVNGGERLEVAGSLSAVPPAVGRAALRIAQEALTNARRHAPGAPAVVEVVVRDDVLVLTVANPAPPVTGPAFTLGSGLGLVGMRERAAALGGSLEAAPVRRSDLAGGWQVCARLPVTAPTPPTAPRAPAPPTAPTAPTGPTVPTPQTAPTPPTALAAPAAPPLSTDDAS